VPFTLVHIGKYRTELKLKIQTAQKKQTMQNTAKQNYPGSVASYDTQPGNKVGLFYNAPHASMKFCSVYLTITWNILLTLIKV